MKGNVNKGLKDLLEVKNSSSSVKFEADILYSVMEGFILQETRKALSDIKKLWETQNQHTLISFLAGSLAIKNSESETALSFFNSVDSSATGLPIWYAKYLTGEVYLHKGLYPEAISSYQVFIENYKGQNFVKDAHYKIGLCYWLDGKTDLAKEKFTEASNQGKETVEADKHAARSLADPEPTNILLSRVRYFTDGGYYAKAQETLDKITPADIPTKKEQVEYYYRKARLTHKQGQTKASKLFYTQTIDMAGDEKWYFAPNSCLQLGFIFLEESDKTSAKKYFRKALAYRKHEYKNSIDSKAKSALDQLE
jgi:tetratricopeptide (TPR) repeat protein